MQCWGAKPFADDLVTERGVVLSRAATTLRSVETYPTFGWLVYDSKSCRTRIRASDLPRRTLPGPASYVVVTIAKSMGGLT